ncbi:hypothetical protein OCU04_002983 [Sclerotinia nivalis]|uniref:Uncharacterized protein n=1 Tax=Sclerotinia nivalis TaxID=352851 RepID=A0A9X0AUR2_9HELO|nr:hypothetical protein OCU04_002983 [Sclerotinia nivalis]
MYRAWEYAICWIGGIVGTGTGYEIICRCRREICGAWGCWVGSYGGAGCVYWAWEYAICWIGGIVGTGTGYEVICRCCAGGGGSGVGVDGSGTRSSTVDLVAGETGLGTS